MNELDKGRVGCSLLVPVGVFMWMSAAVNLSYKGVGVSTVAVF